MRFVAPTDAPHGGRVTFQVGRQRLHPLAGGHAQEDPRVLDLEPGARAAARNGFQDGDIIRIQR
jgi:hypothetical protein